MSEYQDIPTFTPPTDDVPVFTPPSARRTRSGTCCYYHDDEPAVAQCARCGKNLCEDCYEVYGVTAGEYANQALCYDCTQQLVAENVQELTKNKGIIKRQFIFSIIGIVIGLIVGLALGLSNGGNFGSALILGIICAGIGGMFLSFIKFYFSTLWEAIKVGFSGESGSWVGAIIGFVIAIFVGIFKCLYHTIRNTIEYIQYLKKTQGFIESDQEALRQMEDYMEYSIVRSRNKGVDLETLMAQGSELYNNSYAQMVRDEGEERAVQTVANAAMRIAENGEIIRDFAA